LEGGPGPVADFSEAIALAEGLVRHVFELIGHFARTPSCRVVLNHWGHKFGHFTRRLSVGHSHLVFYSNSQYVKNRFVHDKKVNTAQPEKVNAHA
jgi:hypothetical protein